MDQKFITKNDVILNISQSKDEKLFDFITGKEIANKPENREAKVPYQKFLLKICRCRKPDQEVCFCKNCPRQN